MKTARTGESFSEIIDRSLAEPDENLSSLAHRWGLPNESSARGWRNKGTSPSFYVLARLAQRAHGGFNDRELLEVLQAIAGYRARITILPRESAPLRLCTESLRDEAIELLSESLVIQKKLTAALADGVIDAAEAAEIGAEKTLLSRAMDCFFDTLSRVTRKPSPRHVLSIDTNWKKEPKPLAGIG
jgi:transposase-like protein